MEKLSFAFMALFLPTIVLAGGYGVPGPVILLPPVPQVQSVPTQSYEVVPQQSSVTRTGTSRLLPRFSDSREPVASTATTLLTDLQRENQRQAAARQKLMRYLRSTRR